MSCEDPSVKWQISLALAWSRASLQMGYDALAAASGSFRDGLHLEHPAACLSALGPLREAVLQLMPE